MVDFAAHHAAHDEGLRRCHVFILLKINHLMVSK